jgi:hypothetical protein
MNDTTFIALALDAHRAEQLRRDNETLVRRAARTAETTGMTDASAPVQGAAEASASRLHGLGALFHRPARRSTYVATR